MVRWLSMCKKRKLLKGCSTHTFNVTFAVKALLLTVSSVLSPERAVFSVAITHRRDRGGWDEDMTIARGIKRGGG